MRFTRVIRALLAVVPTAVLAMSSVAQPVPPEGPRDGQAPAQDSVKSEEPRADRPGERSGRAGVLQFLRRRLSDLKERQAALEAAMDRVERGEDPAKVREEFEPRRLARREGGGRLTGGPDPMDDDREHSRPDPERSGFNKPGGGGPRGGPDKTGPLSPEDRERALQFLRDHLPKVGARLTEMAKSSPKLADQMLGRFSVKIPELRAAQHDQELFELKVREVEGGLRIMEAMRAYRDAITRKAPDVESKRSELREAFTNQYDTQLAIQKRDADRLARRIEALREEIQERQADRDATIERQLDEVASGRRPGVLGQPGRGGGR